MTVGLLSLLFHYPKGTFCWPTIVLEELAHSTVLFLPMNFHIQPAQTLAAGTRGNNFTSGIHKLREFPGAHWGKLRTTELEHVQGNTLTRCIEGGFL